MTQTRTDTHTAAPGATELTGYLSEMFCSIQGEGLFVGERQVFVRTAGCVATCSWCDTVYSKVRTPRFVTHTDDGTDKPWRPNPVSPQDVVDDVTAFADGQGVRAISLTGGEPLEQPVFAAAIARELDRRGYRIHLETAGLHPEALAQVIGYVRAVAMDVKLPSATGVAHWDAHRAFLALMHETRNPARTDFVKVIMDLNATVDEIERASQLIASIDPATPLILQPESDTLFGRRTTPERSRALIAFAAEALRTASVHLKTVRVIPQTHKLLNIR
jgi:organic radical activating enzyme